MASTHEIWRQRWEALSDDILSRKVELESRLRANFAAFDSYDQNKIRAIVKLLSCLRHFAREYFYYFYDKPDAEWHFNIHKQFSREHVFSTILDQIGYDMETLSRIANDHFALAGEETLRRSDFLAREALVLAQNEGWFPNTSTPIILSYFQKSPSIRVIPYANVLMLGIPYTAQVAQEDLLAIPHEVGHYVFWQGEIENNGNRKSIAQTLFSHRGLDAWCFRWLEELFADIYGVFVAGAFIAQSFQDLQLRSLPKRLVKDDQDHPTPNIRPYIYAKALSNMNHKKSAQFLENQWTTKLTELRRKHQFHDPGNAKRAIDRIYFGNNVDRPIHDKEANVTEGIAEEIGAISNGLTLNQRNPVDKAIQTIFDLFGLPETRQNSQEWSDLVEHIENPDNNQDNILENAAGPVEFKNELYDVFKEFTKTIDVGFENQFNVECRDPKSLLDKWEFLTDKITHKWLPVWHSSGWTTEGPDCESTGGVCTG